MGITNSWVNDGKNIVLCVYQTPWTWEEYAENQTDLHSMISSVPHTVDIIMDVTHGGDLQSGALGRFRRATQNRPSNQGNIVFVGGEGFQKMLIDVVGKTTATPEMMNFAPTQEAAVKLLENLRKSTP